MALSEGERYDCLLDWSVSEQDFKAGLPQWYFDNTPARLGSTNRTALLILMEKLYK